jgi:hypothetical protein
MTQRKNLSTFIDVTRAYSKNHSPDFDDIAREIFSMGPAKRIRRIICLIETVLLPFAIIRFMRSVCPLCLRASSNL